MTQQTAKALKVTNKLINDNSVSSLNCSTISFLLAGKLLLRLFLLRFCPIQFPLVR